MRHWERLSLNDGESLVYWLRKLVFRGAYLDHRVKEDLLEVSFDESDRRLRLRRAGGRPGAARARPDAELALAAVQALEPAHWRRREAEPRLVLGNADPDLADRAERHDQLLRLALVAVRAERDEPEAGLGRDRREPVQRAVGELDADAGPLEPVLGAEALDPPLDPLDELVERARSSRASRARAS